MNVDLTGLLQVSLASTCPLMCCKCISLLGESIIRWGHVTASLTGYTHILLTTRGICVYRAASGSCTADALADDICCGSEQASHLQGGIG